MKKFATSACAIVLAISSVFLFSCEREPSDSVDQDKIFTEYELFYNANEDKTFARATFKFSNALGTKLELAEGGEVSFNDDVLSWKPALAYYEKEYAGRINDGAFVYVDLAGNNFRNELEIKSLDYTAPIDSIDRNAAYELAWNGPALALGEDITVTINGVLEGDIQTFYTNSVGGNSIILAKDKLEQLGQGTSTLYLDRRSYPSIQEGTSAGGILVARIRPENQTPYLN